MKYTLMICYRDLVTEPSQTIQKHSALISKHAYCWWGWWKKPIEIVPHQLLIELATSTEKSPRDVLLYDCGQYHLHKARLIGVDISPLDSGVSSPEIDKTPDYYVHVKCAVWFKFDNIEAVPNSDKFIKKTTYRAFPSWPVESRYRDFIGKKIRNFEELDEMAVTLWQVDICT